MLNTFIYFLGSERPWPYERKAGGQQAVHTYPLEKKRMDTYPGINRTETSQGL